LNISLNATNVFYSSRVCGVGQYVINLLEGFKQIGYLDRFQLIVNSEARKELLKSFPEANIINASYPGIFDRFRWKEHFFRQKYIERRSVPRIHNRVQTDLLFHPFLGQDIYISKSVKSVVVVHDLFLKHFPEQLSKKYYTYLDNSYQETLTGATHIVTPSEFVKRDILKFYPLIPDNKISPIPNPVIVREGEYETYQIETPYILSVNALRYHKNLITLLKAFERIYKQIKHSLVLTGPIIRGVSEQFARYIEEKNIKNIIITGYTSNAQRNFLYKNAALFVSPSLHEGFGITPVEAALFGIPVITTRETSIPEVTKNLLNYYEPATDDERLAEKIMEVLKNGQDPTHSQNVKAVFRNAYSPANIAQEYWKCFIRITGGD
jgi:glycosyltransferase involved in cell wall biosynthesis